VNGQPYLPAPREATAAPREITSVAPGPSHRPSPRVVVIADAIVLQVRMRTARVLYEPLLPKASRPRNLIGQNCTIVFTDVVGFGADSRTEFDRLAIRKAVARMLGAAVVFPYKDACAWEDRGDGLLIVMYPEVPTTAVLDRLVTLLPGELRRHNASSPPGARIQLRVAITVGPVVADEVGLSGKSIIRGARMLDTPAFKKAMAGTGSALGVISSAFVHDLAIEAGADLADPETCAQVRVSVKESRFPAWVQLFEPTLIGPAAIAQT
jgi:hypothetical protein